MAAESSYASVAISRHDHGGAMTFPTDVVAGTACACSCGQRWKLHDRLGWVPLPYRGTAERRVVSVRWPADWDRP